MFPEEWSNYMRIFNPESVQKVLDRFWLDG